MKSLQYQLKGWRYDNRTITVSHRYSNATVKKTQNNKRDLPLEDQFKSNKTHRSMHITTQWMEKNTPEHHEHAKHT